MLIIKNPSQIFDKVKMILLQSNVVDVMIISNKETIQILSCVGTTNWICWTLSYLSFASIIQLNNYKNDLILYENRVRRNFPES